MDFYLIITFIIFCIAEITMLIQMIFRKNKVAIRSISAGFGILILIMITVYTLDLKFPNYVLYLTMAALLLNSIFGYYYEYFKRSAVFDRYLHGFSLFSFALLAYFYITSFTSKGGSKFFQALFILFLGISIGALFEIFEFISDVRNGSKMQKSLKDTNFDIIFDILGSAAAALFSYFAIL